MSYKLKPTENEFQVTREGKFEYRRYRHGETYNEVPPEDLHRFEKIDAEIPKEEEAGTRRPASAEASAGRRGEKK